MVVRLKTVIEMKIKVTKKYLARTPLENGDHPVKIISVNEGESRKGTPFFACKFQNDFGYHTQRFHRTEKTESVIHELFNACGLPIEIGKDLETEQLYEKELVIKIRDSEYVNFETGELIRTKTAFDFRKSIILIDSKE
jgi:hypothetical protein